MMMKILKVLVKLSATFPAGADPIYNWVSMTIKNYQIGL